MYKPSYNYTFIPNLYKEYKGKKYFYCGRFKRDNKLVNDLKRTFFKNGFYTKLQPFGEFFILWCRKR